MSRAAGEVPGLAPGKQGAGAPPRPRWRRLRQIRLVARPDRGLAAFRAWVRARELGLLLLAVLAGIASGVLAALMRAAAQGLHTLGYGPAAAHGLSAMHGAEPHLLLLLPALGGLALAGLNAGLARWWPRNPVDPIEANALHGGRMSLADGGVVAAQNLLSNGGGASVGLEAAYAQLGGGVASRLGRAFGLRRGDMRVLVGCGTSGAIAAAFGAPLTGAFYAFELVIGSYAIPSLAPILTSAVVGSVVADLLAEVEPLAAPGGIASPGLPDFALSLALGLLCGGLAIALMRGVTVAEAGLRRTVPLPWLRPAAGGLAVGALALITPGVLSSGHALLHNVLSVEMGVRALLLLLVLKALASAISIGAGFRGGLFFASLLLGALLGRAVALVLEAAGLGTPDPMLFAIVGMSAFGAGVVGAPLAVTFLALETTGDFAVAAPVLVAVVAASVLVRRLFGYSFATWRFHLRGEAIRGPQDVGWLRDLTVGRMMRRDVRTVRMDTRLPAFRRDFPLGSASRVVAVDEAGRYAGLVLVPEAHAEGQAAATVAEILQAQDRALLPAMGAKQAMALFEAAEAEALAVLDGLETRRVLGTLTEAHLLRRYGEEVDKRRHEEAGLP